MIELLLRLAVLPGMGWTSPIPQWRYFLVVAGKGAVADTPLLMALASPLSNSPFRLTFLG